MEQNSEHDFAFNRKTPSQHYINVHRFADNSDVFRMVAAYIVMLIELKHGRFYIVL